MTQLGKGAFSFDAPYPARFFSTKLLCLPAKNAIVIAITQWTMNCLIAGHSIYIPEIIDYELRRELLRAGKTNSIVALDKLKDFLTFLPISSPAMLCAADL